MKQPTDTPITVTAANRPELEERLEAAESAARNLALASGRREGILVTRHDHSTFTVDLDSTIPFGLTIESEQWHR